MSGEGGPLRGVSTSLDMNGGGGGNRTVLRVPQHVGACYKPLTGLVVLLIDGRAVEVELTEAEHLRDMLTVALAIAGGFHPLQVETARQSFAENANKSGGAQ